MCHAHLPLPIAGGRTGVHHGGIDDDHVATAAHASLVLNSARQRPTRNHRQAMRVVRVRRIAVADELALEHDGVHDVWRVPELDRLRRSSGSYCGGVPGSGWEVS